MKVKELIKRLQECDPESYVCYPAEDELIEIEEIGTCRGAKNALVDVCNCENQCVCKERITILH